MKIKSVYLLCLPIIATASLLLTGCGNPTDAAPSAAASMPSTAAPAISPPASAARGPGGPISVTVTTAKKRDFDITIDAIGTVTAVSSVEVRPQISSVVTKVHIKEGQFVRAGELLFTLDPRPDEANVAKVRAQIAKDEAVLADVQRQLARGRDLLAKGFVSQGSLDSTQSQVEAQLANLVADRAALDAAQLGLSYHTIRAPGAGRLGAVGVFPGTAVQANQTALVTITQLDPVNITFNLPQRNLDTVLEGVKSGRVTVNATLPESNQGIVGNLQFVDNTVDAATGTIKVKARFNNADFKLWPGGFVKTSMVSRTLTDTVGIPTTAIIQSSKGAIVYLAENGKAALRPVKLIAAQGDESAVSGINAGDQVVVEGRQNLRPETPLLVRKAGPAVPTKSPAPAVSSSAAS
jgi:RND family efflux transporter MFP subunit